MRFTLKWKSVAAPERSSKGFCVSGQGAIDAANRAEISRTQE